jgi:hypothetical protein
MTPDQVEPSGTSVDLEGASLSPQSDNLDRELKETPGPPNEYFGLGGRYQHDAVLHVALRGEQLVSQDALTKRANLRRTKARQLLILLKR